MMIWRGTHFIMTVDQLVLGSIPTAGANQNRGLANLTASFLWISQTLS